MRWFNETLSYQGCVRIDPMCYVGEAIPYNPQMMGLAVRGIGPMSIDMWYRAVRKTILNGESVSVVDQVLNNFSNEEYCNESKAI